MYKNRNAQEAAWLNISRQIGLEGRPSCARTKWRDLRDTYRKKLKAMSPKSGDPGGTKRSTWPWMKSMEFTKRFFNIEVPTVSNFQGGGLELDFDFDEETQPVNSTVDTSQLDSMSVTNADVSAGSNDSLFNQADDNTFQPIKPNVSGKRKRKENDVVANAIDMAILAELKSSPAPEKENEDSLFLRSLVPQLKRLDPHSKAKAKCEIQQLLFEYEFGEKKNN